MSRRKEAASREDPHGWTSIHEPLAYAKPSTKSRKSAAATTGRGGDGPASSFNTSSGASNSFSTSNSSFGSARQAGLQKSHKARSSHRDSLLHSSDRVKDRSSSRARSAPRRHGSRSGSGSGSGRAASRASQMGGGRSGSGSGHSKQVPSPPLSKSPPSASYSPRSQNRGTMSGQVTNPNSGSRASSRAASRDGDFWRASSSTGTASSASTMMNSSDINGREKEERLTEQLRAALTSSERDQERERELEQRARARSLMGSRERLRAGTGSPSFGFRGASAGVMSSGGFDFLVGGRPGASLSAHRRAGTAGGNGGITHMGDVRMSADSAGHSHMARPMFGHTMHENQPHRDSKPGMRAAHLSHMHHLTQQSSRHEDHKARQLNEQLKHALMMSGDDVGGAGSDRGSVSSRDGINSPGGRNSRGSSRGRTGSARRSSGGDGRNENDFFFSTFAPQAGGSASATQSMSSPYRDKPIQPWGSGVGDPGKNSSNTASKADKGTSKKKKKKRTSTDLLFSGKTQDASREGSDSTQLLTKRQQLQKQHLQTQNQRVPVTSSLSNKSNSNGATSSTTSTTLDARRRYRQKVMGRRAESAHFARHSSDRGGSEESPRRKKRSSRKKRNQSADIIRHRQRLRRAALLQRPPSRQRSPFPTHLAEFEFKRFHAFGNKPGGGTIGAANRNQNRAKDMGVTPMDTEGASLLGPRKMYQPAAARNIDESPRPPSRHRPPSSNLHLHSEESKKGDGSNSGTKSHKTALKERSFPDNEDLVVDEQEPDEGSEIVAGSGREPVTGSHQTQALFMSTTVGGTDGNSQKRGHSGGAKGQTLGQDLYDLTLEPPREHAIPIQITTRTRDGGHAITTTTTLEVAKLHMKKLALEQKKRLKRLEKKSKKKDKTSSLMSNHGQNISGADGIHTDGHGMSPRAQEIEEGSNDSEVESDDCKFSIFVNSDEEEHYGQKSSGDGRSKESSGTKSHPLSLNLATIRRQPSQASLESQRNQRLALQEYEQALISSRTTPRRLHSSSSSRRPTRSSGSGGTNASSANLYDDFEGVGLASARADPQDSNISSNKSGDGDQKVEMERADSRNHFNRAQTADAEIGYVQGNSTLIQGQGDGHYQPPLTAYADVPDPISNPRIRYSDEEADRPQVSENARSSRETRKHERRKEKRRRRRRRRRQHNSRRNYREVDDADTELREWERQMANTSGGGSVPTSAGSSNHPTPRGGGAGGEGWFEELFGGRDEGGMASSDASSYYYSSSEDVHGNRQNHEDLHRRRKKSKKKSKKKKRKKRAEVEELFSGGAGPDTSRSCRRSRDEWSISSRSL